MRPTLARVGGLSQHVGSAPVELRRLHARLRSDSPARLAPLPEVPGPSTRPALFAPQPSPGRWVGGQAGATAGPAGSAAEGAGAPRDAGEAGDGPPRARVRPGGGRPAGDPHA